MSRYEAVVLPELPDVDPDAPPIPGMRFHPVEERKQHQPAGLFLLFFVEMWEQFSYYGMRALLVLYLVGIIALPDVKPGVHETSLVIRNRTTNVEQLRQPVLVIDQPKDAVIPTVWPPIDALHVDAPSGEIIRATNGRLENLSIIYVLTNTSQADIRYDFEFAGPDGAASGGPVKATPTLGRWVQDEIDPARGRVTTDVLSGTLKPAESTTVTIQASEFNSGRGLQPSTAMTIYGWYAGLVYLTAILGGLIADKLIGPHRSLIIGGLLIALGHTTLALASWQTQLVQSELGMAVFIGGLALIVMGTGHFKPAVPVMVGQLYKPNDARRDGGFSIFYMGTRVGAFLCAFFCGSLGETLGWHWGFGASAAGMFVGMIMYLIGRRGLLKGVGLAPAGVRNYAPLVFLLSFVAAAGFGYVWHVGGPSQIVRIWSEYVPDATSQRIVIGFLATTVVGIILWFIAIQARGEKGPVAGIIFLVLFNAIFWMGFEQAGPRLHLFASQYADRTLGGHEVPALWLMAVNPMVILLMAPIFAVIWTRLGRKNRNPSQAVKFAMGLMLLGAGYMFMVAAAEAVKDGSKIPVMWLIMTFVMHTLGELCVAPTGLSFVTRTAPVRYVGFLMGIWFLGNFLAGASNVFFAGWFTKIESGEQPMFWYKWIHFGGLADYFMLFVVMSIGAGLLILILSPIVNRMIHGRG